MPGITQNPISTNGVEVSGIELTLGIEGQDTSIQWFKDGQPNWGATGSPYVVGALSVSDAGVHAAAVTNAAGRVLSQSAVVNILESPDITDGLVAHFKLDGNGDDSASGPAASLEGGAGFGDGQIGRALELSGSGQCALTPDFERNSWHHIAANGATLALYWAGEIFGATDRNRIPVGRQH